MNLPHYNKFIVALIGTIATGLVTFGLAEQGMIDEIVPLVTSLVTAIMVYIVPNRPSI